MAMKIASRKALIAQARTYMDAPFKHRGRSRKGVDCAGLIICSLRDLGYQPFDLRVYGREPARDGLRQVVEKNLGAPVDMRTMMPGDVALCRFNKQPHHVALVGDHPAGGLSFIHSFGSVGKVVEHGIDEHWRSLIVAVYRFEEEAM